MALLPAWPALETLILALLLLLVAQFVVWEKGRVVPEKCPTI